MPDRLSVEAYCGQYFIYSDEGVRLRDIVNGEPIRSGHPAPSVLEDSVLSHGIEYLHYLRERDINIDLVLGLHGNKERFDDILIQRKEVLLGATAVGVEMNWLSNADKPTLETATLQPAKIGGLADFHETELTYLRGINKPILPCDARVGSLAYLAIQDAWQLVDMQPRPDIGERVRNRVRVLAYAAIQTTRHWAMLGQFGYWLSNLDARLKTGDSVALIEGVEHAPDEQKLRKYFGLNVVPHIINHRNPPKGRVSLDGSIFLDGFITDQQLDTPLHF